MSKRPLMAADLEFGRGTARPIGDGFRVQAALRLLVKGAEAPPAAEARGHTDSAFAKVQPRIQVALDLMPLRNGRAPPRSLHDALSRRKSPLESTIAFIAPCQPLGGFDPLQAGQFSMVRITMPGTSRLPGPSAHALPHVANVTTTAHRGLPLK